MEIKRKLKVFIITLCIICMQFGMESAYGLDSRFPVFVSIEPNVNFWTKVYSKYSSAQGIIHDRNNPSIIYEVIEFNKSSRKARRRLVKRAKTKYRKILKRLVYNRPSTSEEERVAALFGLWPNRNELLKASDNIRFQLGQKDRFRKGLIRSGAYMTEIKQILADYDMPQDLAYLPHVESSFNFKAYSKAGAAGLWQFTRGTGKKFLKINQAIDERLDPIRATHAAAKLMKINYEILKNWPLAITAYNHGAGGMLRAKKRKGGYEKIFNEYRGRRFRFASRNFYSEFLAAKKVAKNYTRYFGNLTLNHPLQKTKNMLMKGYAPVDKLAASFNMSQRELKRLNPALKKSVFRGNRYVPKGYRLHLPDNKKISSLIAALPSNFFKSAPLKSRGYRVRRGDSLSVIARRNGVKTRDLMAANGLSRRSVIYAGQKLIIPGGDGVVVPKKKRFDKSRSYRVRRGDSLSVIARRNGVRAGDLMAANGLSRRSVIYAGQKLIIPGAEKLASLKKKRLKAKSVQIAQTIPKELKETRKNKIDIVLAEDFALFDSHLISNASNSSSVNKSDKIGKANKTLAVRDIFQKRGKTYGFIKVAAAETLGHYADWLDVETRRIRRLNDLNFRKRIKLNDRLVIPLSRVNKAAFERLRQEYRRQMEDDFLNGYKVVKFRLYKMERGDNIWRLCRNDFDLPVWLIKKYNPELDLHNLKPSQTIVIPVLKKKT